MSDDIKLIKNEARPCFTMASVRTMTGLTDRQIRYYEEMGLIKPMRTRGNQRIFSSDEVEKLHEIKKMLDEGLTVEAIKGAFTQKEQPILEYTPVEPERTLPGMTRGLTSLYPVSNRAQLVQMIVQRRRAQARQQAEEENQ